MMQTAYTQAVKRANNRKYTDVVDEMTFHARREACYNCPEETRDICDSKCAWRAAVKSTTCPDGKWVNIVTGNLTVGV